MKNLTILVACLCLNFGFSQTLNFDVNSGGFYKFVQGAITKTCTETEQTFVICPIANAQGRKTSAILYLDKNFKISKQFILEPKNQDEQYVMKDADVFYNTYTGQMTLAIVGTKTDFIKQKKTGLIFIFDDNGFVRQKEVRVPGEDVDLLDCIYHTFNDCDPVPIATRLYVGGSITPDVGVQNGLFFVTDENLSPAFGSKKISSAVHPTSPTQITEISKYKSSLNDYTMNSCLPIMVFGDVGGRIIAGLTAVESYPTLGLAIEGFDDGDVHIVKDADSWENLDATLINPNPSIDNSPGQDYGAYILTYGEHAHGPYIYSLLFGEINYNPLANPTFLTQGSLLELRDYAIDIDNYSPKRFLKGTNTSGDPTLIINGTHTYSTINPFALYINQNMSSLLYTEYGLSDPDINIPGHDLNENTALSYYHNVDLNIQAYTHANDLKLTIDNLDAYPSLCDEIIGGLNQTTDPLMERFEVDQATIVVNLDPSSITFLTGVTGQVECVLNQYYKAPSNIEEEIIVIEPKSYSLYSINGKILKSSRVKKEVTDNLELGMYILITEYEDGTFSSEKLIK